MSEQFFRCNVAIANQCAEDQAAEESGEIGRARLNSQNTTDQPAIAFVLCMVGKHAKWLHELFDMNSSSGVG